MTRGRHDLAALAAALALGAGPAHGRDEPFDPFSAAGVDLGAAGVIPLDLPLQDESGRVVSLRELSAGQPLVIAPVQHRCPNICGLTLDGLRAAVAGQSYRPGRDFSLVALGIDPREAPAAAQLSEQRLGGVPPAAGVHAVVGAPAALARVTNALGYRYAWDPRIGQYAHVAAVAVVTPDGRLSRWLFGVAPSAQDLHLALTEAARGRLGGLGDQIRLLCYHYDPRSGRYSGLVMELFRATGALSALGLALFVAGLLRRERRGPAA